MADSYNARTHLKVGDKQYAIHSLKALEPKHDLARLPYSLKILLENLLRHEDGVNVTTADIDALASWKPQDEPDKEISFTPARVILQDFTGVPAIVDLAAMRDAMRTLGGDPGRINPLSPAELVIDHSVQVDRFGTAQSLSQNTEIEFGRNKERYSFLRWGQDAFSNFRVVPPNTGIVHQVNIEYLARVVFGEDKDGELTAWPDTLVGTDSHTTMVNGLGVLGWGVGGIEAEAAMLGQPVTMLIPQVVGFKLTGSLPEGSTATDLVLTVTRMLRDKGVVGKFVEFFGDGLKHLPLADRATIANMSPEFGSTCAIFPIDGETTRYLRLTGRPDEQVALVEAYAKAQGLWREDGAKPAEYTDVLELDLGEVVPSIAGPRRPQDLVRLTDAAKDFEKNAHKFVDEAKKKRTTTMPNFENEGGASAVGRDRSVARYGVPCRNNGDEFELRDGAVVIAAITSCTNTSNPAVMLGAGLVARKARERGLRSRPWVKTSLAPGSLVVTEYLKKAAVLDDLAAMGFHLVGYGCTTCIGNSGPLPDAISKTIQQHDLVAVSVLSGNRNFEGRIHPEVKMNYLASPPLVVAYAIAGRMDIDLYKEPLGEDAKGNAVFLKDIWPTQKEIHTAMAMVDSEMFRSSYKSVFDGDENWNSLEVPSGDLFAWDDDSTYVQNPPYFTGMTQTPDAISDIKGARALALLGDMITTDHISPAGSIKLDSPAGKYLSEHGVEQIDFNSYGSRRGNHEVMMRGTFANIRLRNLLAPGTEGGWTTYQPDGEQMFIYDAAMRYQEQGVPLVVLTGKEYGAGSSRDWAAKGTRLLGVRAVIAESYERIHRSNLVGMGVLPLQFNEGDGPKSLGLDGTESFDITGIDGGRAKTVHVKATKNDGTVVEFDARVRIDTPKEVEYFQHGGILHYVLRQLAA
ncbi:MAG: aconitate hydratase AcnA [Xanthomonadaceae bacterium]|nr:aconitate hydratase AcnA [Xanthomonadaceae bacterium]